MEKESGIRVMDGWMDGCKQAAAGFYYSFDFDCGGGGGGGDGSRGWIRGSVALVV